MAELILADATGFSDLCHLFAPAFVDDVLAAQEQNWLLDLDTVVAWCQGLAPARLPPSQRRPAGGELTMQQHRHHADTLAP